MKSTKQLFDRRKARVRSTIRKRANGKSASVRVPLRQAHLCPGDRRRRGQDRRRRLQPGEGSARSSLKTGADSKDAASAVGKLIAERAKAAGVETVIFDRGGYIYHGRVKALADAAREGGLSF